MGDWHPTIAELLFAILLVVIPWGFSKELPLIWKLIMWGVAWAILLHLVFTQVPSLIARPTPVKVLLLGRNLLLGCGSVGVGSFILDRGTGVCHKR